MGEHRIETLVKYDNRRLLLLPAWFVCLILVILPFLLTVVTGTRLFVRVMYPYWKIYNYVSGFNLSYEEYLDSLKYYLKE